MYYILTVCRDLLGSMAPCTDRGKTLGQEGTKGPMAFGILLHCLSLGRQSPRVSVPSLSNGCYEDEMGRYVGRLIGGS